MDTRTTMSAQSPEDIVTSGADLVERYGGLTPFVRQVGVGGVLYALILQVADLIGSIGTVLLSPFRALGRGLAELVGGTLGTGVDIVAAGGEQTIFSLTEGLAAFLGPLAFPASVAIVMSAVYVFVRLVAEIEFSPFVFVGRR